MNSYWRSIVTVALPYIISDTKRDISRKSRFFSYLHSTPQLGHPHRNVAITFGLRTN